MYAIVGMKFHWFFKAKKVNSPSRHFAGSSAQTICVPSCHFLFIPLLRASIFIGWKLYLRKWGQEETIKYQQYMNFFYIILYYSLSIRINSCIIGFIRCILFRDKILDYLYDDCASIDILALRLCVAQNFPRPGGYAWYQSR